MPLAARYPVDQTAVRLPPAKLGVPLHECGTRCVVRVDFA